MLEYLQGWKPQWRCSKDWSWGIMNLKTLTFLCTRLTQLSPSCWRAPAVATTVFEMAVTQQSLSVTISDVWRNKLRAADPSFLLGAYLPKCPQEHVCQPEPFPGCWQHRPHQLANMHYSVLIVWHPCLFSCNWCDEFCPPGCHFSPVQEGLGDASVRSMRLPRQRPVSFTLFLMGKMCSFLNFLVFEHKFRVNWVQQLRNHCIYQKLHLIFNPTSLHPWIYFPGVTHTRYIITGIANN